MNFLEGAAVGFLVIVASVLYADASSRIGRWIVRVLVPVLATAVFTLDLLYSAITPGHVIPYPWGHAFLVYLAALGFAAVDNSPLDDLESRDTTRNTND